MLLSREFYETFYRALCMVLRALAKELGITPKF